MASHEGASGHMSFSRTSVLTLCMLPIVISLAGLAKGQDYAFPANEYSYSLQRDSLKEAENEYQGKISDLTEVSPTSAFLVTLRTRHQFSGY